MNCAQGIAIPLTRGRQLGLTILGKNNDTNNYFSHWEKEKLALMGINNWMSFGEVIRFRLSGELKFSEQMDGSPTSFGLTQHFALLSFYKCASCVRWLRNTAFIMYNNPTHSSCSWNFCLLRSKHKLNRVILTYQYDRCIQCQRTGWPDNPLVKARCLNNHALWCH